MNVYLNSITGIDDAIVAMYFSKRTWTRELEEHIRKTCAKKFVFHNSTKEDDEEIDKWISQICKMGWKHITILRYIDFSVTVEGLHRAGQDDWDAHAKRYDNRIIRSSTRLATFDYEMSDYYKDKIIPTDIALYQLGIEAPSEIEHNGIKYVKTVNGYIREDMKDNKDVKRGLYMLSIPSNFIFKVNLTEWAHVYKERNENGTANPEVKELAENLATLIEEQIPQFDRKLLLKIMN